MTARRRPAGWWRPDSGVASPVIIKDDTGGACAWGTCVAISEGAAQLAVDRGVENEMLATFDLDRGHLCAWGTSAEVPKLWCLSGTELRLLQQLSTGATCGNCGRAARCLRRVCDGWCPMSKVERRRRALPGPFATLPANWQEWSYAPVRQGPDETAVALSKKSAIEELLENHSIDSGLRQCARLEWDALRNRSR
jgi:hypothetical protein